MSDQHLIGTESDDFLSGAEGNDWLEGLGGNDTLIGGDGNDLLDGGIGQDTMFGGTGDDYYVVDDSSDWVTENADEGVDTVESSATSYQLFENIENLTLVGAALGGTGNDSNNIITGNDENNYLSGRGGDDVLIGGAGDDYLVESGEGNDLLIGGAGNDFMIGLGGDDVYEAGIGSDIVLDTYGDDEVRMAPGVDPDQVERIRASSGLSLELRIAGTNDSVSLYNWFHDPNYRIERIVFDDGTVWSIEDTESLRILGTAGDDPGLVGSIWSERIEGFTGNDYVASGAGDDVVVLQGDGFDWVQDSAGDDEVHWQGVDASQVERVRASTWGPGGDNLVLRVAATGQQLTLSNWFVDPSFQIERIVFDDGTVWTAAEAQSLRVLGTAGDDFLWGSPYDETIYARGGNDQVNGWLGDDVYEMGPGLGFDVITDAGGNDEVRFGAGVVAAELERSRDWSNGDLILHLPNTMGMGEGLRIAGWFNSPENQIERFVFDDGTVWTAAEAQALRILGTAGDDFLWGSPYDETIYARGGNDQVNGWLGDDVYEMGPGLGFDVVTDSGGNDEVRFGAGVVAAELERSRDWSNGDLILHLPNTMGMGEGLRIAGWFNSPENQIERFVFDDGTVWTAAEAQALRILGTAGDDFLWGSPYDETIYARGGNDQVNGWLGDDVYEMGPGLGFDVVTDAGGNDEVRFGAGVVAAELERSRDWSNGDLILHLPNTMGMGEGLRIAGWFNSPENQIERFVFDDGTVWTAAEAQALRILGTAGDDFLWGSPYDETIYARGGNDQVNGWLGDDVYEMGPGLGFDVVTDAGGNDEVRFGAGVVAAELERSRDWSNGDLILHLPNTMGMGEGLRIAGWFNSPENQIERFVFDDGTVWTAAEAQALRILGTAGDDFLWGSPYDETIYGMGGNDVLRGLGGNDTLFGGAGDDFYAIDDAGDQVVEYAGEGIDTVESSITQYQLTDNVENLTLLGSAWSGIGNGAANTITGNNESNYILGEGGDDILIGGWGNDILRGGDGDDTLLGGEGDDWLEGGAGNDTYIRYNESGSDLISDMAQAGAGNQLYLAAYNSSEVQLDYSGMFLELRNLAGELLVSLTGFSHLDALSAFRAVEQYRFADTTIGYEQLLSRGFDIHATGNVSEDYVEGTNVQDRIYGSAQAETLVGYAGDDQLTGGGGNDTLQGMEGNDHLYGGTGDDEMLGGVGSDTYYFDRIGGHDRILELVELSDDHGDVDSLVFDYDILPEDLNVSLDSLGRLVIGINGSDATLTFNEWFNTEISTRVERFVFQNGTVLTDDDITAMLNDAPVLANPIADQTARDTVTFSFTVPADAFVDPDAGDTLTYAATPSGMAALPSWLAFDPATRTFSGTPTAANIGSTFNVEVTATDSHGESVSDVFAISVGAAPDQTITGTAGNDTLTGGSGNDTIDGLAGVDDMLGGLGDDTYFVDNNSDDAIEDVGAGFDTIYASVGYTLDANVEKLVLTGNTGIHGNGNALANIIIGDASDNDINGLQGADTLIGGAGDDNYFVDNTGDVVIEAAGEGIDHVYATLAAYTLPDNVEHLDLVVTNGGVAIGNALNNQIHGGQGNDVLRGEGGNDFLNGWLGNDYIDGGAGADMMIGAEGDDTYVVDNSGDGVSEGSADWGNDTVLSYISYSLINALNVENLTLIGTAAINGSGNSLDNVLTGNSAANILLGGAGNDTYYVGAGDTVSENSNAGTDTVIADVSWTLSGNVENLTLAGNAAIDGTGNSGANIIRGNAGNNTLDGGSGTDTLYGGAGDDVYIVTSSADGVNELAGEGDDTIRSSGTRTIAANVEALVLTGTSSINGTGNSGANLIRGNTGNNTLQGSGGNDILEGGDGNDTLSDTSGNALLNGGAGTDSLTGGSGRELYIGGAGNDSITTGGGADIIAFNAADGQDTVASSTGTDNSLSLGGGIAYANLFFSKSGTNLVLSTGGSDRVTFSDWYSSTSNRSVLSLQVVAEAMAGFNPAGGNTLLDQKVERFDFQGLVGAFDAARAATPGLTSWALSNALLQFSLGGSDSAALGGDLAYRYGLSGSLAGIGFAPAQQILGSTQFGTQAQALQPTATLEQGAIRLS